MLSFPHRHINEAAVLKNADMRGQRPGSEARPFTKGSDAFGAFLQKQFQIQAAQLSGQELDAELMSNFQQSLQILTSDPKAAQYLQAEMTFATMISDVYKILEDAMKVN